MLRTKRTCPKCGEEMVFQGGKFVCMNEKCTTYLEGQKKGKSALAEGLRKGE